MISRLTDRDQSVVIIKDSLKNWNPRSWGVSQMTRTIMMRLSIVRAYCQLENFQYQGLFWKKDE